MILILKLLCSPWFWVDIILSISGGLIVYWGLLIEKKAEKMHPPDEFKPDIFEDIIKAQKSEEERGWRILMTGIVIEVVAAFGISIISGLEIAELNDKASTATMRAEQAGKVAAESIAFAAQVGITNAQLSLKVEELRSNNLSLTLKIQETAKMASDTRNFVSEPNTIARLDEARSTVEEANALASTKVLPVKERLKDLLNNIDPIILPNLKNGITNFHGAVREAQRDALLKIASEAGAQQFITINPDLQTVAIGPTGTFRDVNFSLSTILINTP